jgi:predicted choloylglycine hydrolase
LKSLLITIVVTSFNHTAMPKNSHYINRQLLDGKQNNRLAQLHKAPKPQATTYRNRHRIPKLTQLGYIENRVIERLQTNDSTYSEKFNLGNRIKYIHMYVGKNKPIVNCFRWTLYKTVFYPLYQIRKLLKRKYNRIRKRRVFISKTEKYH